jgi:hypothetical protein
MVKFAEKTGEDGLEISTQQIREGKYDGKRERGEH